MAEITMELIKQLRERTGVGIGKCKEALQETSGDIEKAIAYLRKKGIASAVKKEGREANEGKIGIAEKNGSIALVEVNSETDFVANNEKFIQFLNDITEEVISTKPSSLENFLKQKFSKDGSLTIDEYRASIVQMIGENIQISRLLILEQSPETSFGVYSHMGGKIVAAIELKGSADQQALAKEIAMHTAAATPDYLNPEEVPSNVIEHEKEIARTQVQNKPENIIEKILEGKLRAFYDQVCLTKQKFIKDDSVTVEGLVANAAKESGKPLTVSRFIRWSLGQK